MSDKTGFLSKYFKWLTGFVTQHGDDEEIVTAKRIWFTLILIATITLGPNTLVYFAIGIRNWILGSLIYTVFHLILLTYFIILKRNIGILILLTQFFYIFFSFAMVLISGGILYSGGTVLIGLVGGPIISLIFPLKKKSYLILIIYLCTLVAEYILQPFLIRDPEITPELSLLFFLLHIMVVTTTIFLILRYFIGQNKKNQEKEKSLLRKILPGPIVREIMETGKSSSIRYEDTSILFADFMEFTNIVASIPAKKLVDELNDIFHYFDDIMERHGLEKIKTIGDGYLAACGLPESDPIHGIKCVRAAKEMIEYTNSRNEDHAIKWKIRIGIHSGPVSAGVVGKNKFTFDIFGDTVNIASRIESAGHEGKINISAYSYDLIKDEIPCEYRGKIEVKGKGKLDMYYVK